MDFGKICDLFIAAIIGISIIGVFILGLLDFVKDLTKEPIIQSNKIESKNIIEPKLKIIIENNISDTVYIYEKE